MNGRVRRAFPASFTSLSVCVVWSRAPPPTPRIFFVLLEIPSLVYSFLDVFEEQGGSGEE